MLPAVRQKRKNTPAGKCLLWLLVLTLFWCSAGTVVWNSARTVCYHYMRHHKNTSADTLVVSAPSLVWVKKDEIRYRGRMFDVKKQVKQADGRLLLIGHYDEADSVLFAMLEEMMGEDKEQQQNNNPFFWSFHAVLATPVYIKEQYFDTPALKLCTYKAVLYSPYETSPPTPPPDVVA